MKRTPRAGEALFRGTTELRTIGEWLTWAEAAYERHGLAYGQVSDNAHDEALYLLLHTLGLPLDSRPAVLRRVLPAEAKERVKAVLRRRIVERTPTAYLTGEAWLGGHRFVVDERVLIPRSYFVELIPTLVEHWGSPDRVRHAVDVCTGSACLAILLAYQFPRAAVDAIDLSPDALAVARANVAAHACAERVALHQSDVFDAVPPKRYDLILSNPPYEPSALCDELPPEFSHEPRLALDGGADGLDIIRKLLTQARDRLAPDGLVVIEVGGLQAAMEAAFPHLPLAWLETGDGSNCVCAIRASDLCDQGPARAPPRRACSVSAGRAPAQKKR